MNRIFLIGYRACGKTTVGPLLAQRLGWQWCDADVLLEERHGKSIRTIFAEEGEAGFRDKESALLAELAGRTNHVIATGGGVVLRDENRRHLKSGFVVWLRASPRVLWERIQADATTAERRPDLAQGGLAETEDLLRVRTPLYETCADLICDVEGKTPAEIVEEIRVRQAEG